MLRLRAFCFEHLPNDLNPFFWDRPAIMNLFVLAFAIVFAFWVAVWTIWFMIKVPVWPVF